MHLPLPAGRFRSFLPRPRHAIKHRLQMLFFRPVCRNDDTDAQGSRMLPLERKCLFVRLLPGIDLLFLPNPLQHRPHGISDSVFLQIIPGFFQIGEGKNRHPSNSFSCYRRLRVPKCRKTPTPGTRRVLLIRDINPMPERMLHFCCKIRCWCSGFFFYRIAFRSAVSLSTFACASSRLVPFTPI